MNFLEQFPNLLSLNSNLNMKNILIHNSELSNNNSILNNNDENIRFQKQFNSVISEEKILEKKLLTLY